MKPVVVGEWAAVGVGYGNSNRGVLKYNPESLLTGSQRLFGLCAGRDVILKSNEMRHVSRCIANWRNPDLIPEHRLVLAEVSQRGRHFMSLFDCIPNCVAAGLITILALQKAAVAPQYFVTRITGQPLESGVAVDNRTSFLHGIDNHDAV